MLRRPLLTALALALALAGCGAEDDTAEPGSTAPPTGGPVATPTPGPGQEPDTPPSPTGDGEPTPSPTDDPDPTPSPDEDGLAGMSFDVCESNALSVPFPTAWQTDGIADQCRVFHPDPIDLPEEPQGIGLHWAVTIFIDAVRFEDVTGQPPGGELLDRRTTTVDGRDAVVTEYRSDGIGLYPEGEEVYFYAVDLDGETLIARTTTVGETDYERDRRVVDRMMAGLEVTGG